MTEFAFGLPALTTNSTVESFTFAELEEFNNYSVIIAAENQVGRGNFSIVLNFSTPQAGKHSLITTKRNLTLLQPFQHRLVLLRTPMERE